MINILLFVLFFVACYLLVDRMMTNRQVNQFQKRNSVQEFAKENSIKKLFSKINLIKTKENQLFLQGYPLKLNAITYYALKAFLTIVFLLAGIMNYRSYFVAIILGLFGFCFLDVYIALHKKSRNHQICNDLLQVTQSITMQLSAYMPLKESLKMQYTNCQNRDFQKAMMVFATKYELSEFNIDEALRDLNSRFDIAEVDVFCNTIRQYNQVGNIIELLENLSTTLKEKYMQHLKTKTREKVLYITLGVILALGNMILMIFYPLFMSVGNRFNEIFK